MISRQKPLPTTEELRFRQAIQCMTCLNPGQSIVECTLRTHCAICHSNAHTLDHCEYSLLNKVVASVRRIEPQDDDQEDWNWSQFWDNDRLWYDEHYRLDRNRRNDLYNDYLRDDDRHNDDRRDNRNRYDHDYSKWNYLNYWRPYKGHKYNDDWRRNDDNRHDNRQFNDDQRDDNRRPKGSRQFQHNSKGLDDAESQDVW